MFLPHHLETLHFSRATSSNYASGTEFEIEDAYRIIETGQPMPARNADSHDVLEHSKS